MRWWETKNACGKKCYLLNSIFSHIAIPNFYLFSEASCVNRQYDDYFFWNHLADFGHSDCIQRPLTATVRCVYFALSCALSSGSLILGPKISSTKWTCQNTIDNILYYRWRWSNFKVVTLFVQLRPPCLLKSVNRLFLDYISSVPFWWILVQR